MKKIYYLTMNLKERGITIGDLLIIFIIIVISSLSLKALKKEKETTFNQSPQEKIFNDIDLLSRKNFTAIIINI